MSGFRIPGVLGLDFDLPIDAGTLSRTMSFAPRSTGADDHLLQWVRQAIRKGAHEGMRVAGEVIVKAALLELQRLQGDLEAQLILISHLPVEVRNQVAYQTFSSGFDHPLPKKFLRQYVWAHGAALRLSEREMIDCNPYINFAGRKSFEPHLEAAKRQPGVPLPLTANIPAGALTNGTLGNFTVKVTGTVTAMPVVGWVVRGDMSFYDKWDFDPKDFFTSGRSFAGEMKTRLANAWLPGTAFEITSETVPFEQSQSDATVVWSGGTPKGVPDRVSKVESSILAFDQ